MSAWRKMSTAPRDGTIIVGLFERAHGRAIAMRAAFDVDDYRRLLQEPAPDGSAQWVKDGEADALEQFRNDPSYGFQPVSDEDSDRIGRIKAWRPIAGRAALAKDQANG